jgi:hypothetical protein
VEREIRHHAAVRHPGVVALLAAFEDADAAYLVMELAGARGGGGGAGGRRAAGGDGLSRAPRARWRALGRPSLASTHTPSRPGPRPPPPAGGDLFEAVKRAPGRRFDEATAVGAYLTPLLVGGLGCRGGGAGPRRSLGGPALAAATRGGARGCRGAPRPTHPFANTRARAQSALAHLHSRGIVHRDIKPENILLARPPPRRGAAAAGTPAPAGAGGGGASAGGAEPPLLVKLAGAGGRASPALGFMHEPPAGFSLL